jgi:hypothetical protein
VTVPTSDLISAGYYLTARVPRPDWFVANRDLLPPSIITLAPCLAPVVPDGWPTPAIPGFKPSDSTVRAFGLTPDRRADVERYVSGHFDKDPHRWPWVPLELDEAVAFARHVAASAPGMLLVGVALAADDAARLQATIGPQSASERSVALERGLAPAEGGTILGYEVLGDGVLDSHSILCTGGEVDVARDLSIRFNADGLIDDAADARRAAVWASQDGHAEPVPYFAWRLTRYGF